MGRDGRPLRQHAGRPHRVRPIEPVGAIAEPDALWAIENQDGLDFPFTHPSIVLTDDLASFERLKLYILSLGHTALADIFMR